MAIVQRDGAPDVSTEIDLAPVRERLLESTLSAVMSRGIAGVTLDEIAADAGCSRATLYRHFPGKRQLLRAALEREVASALSGLETVLSSADDLEDCMASGIMFGIWIFAEREPLRLLLTEDPDLALPFLSFSRANETMRATADVVARQVWRFGLSHDDGYRLGEWATRLVLSFATAPSTSTDMTDATEVRRLVKTFMMPAFSPAPTLPDGMSDGSASEVPEAAHFRN